MIEPGVPWGEQVPRPAALTIAQGDADLVRQLEHGLRHAVGVGAGDVYRSLGSPGVRDPVVAVPIDALRIRLDGEREHTAIAHVVVRRSWLRGRVIAVMNVDRIGNWNVAPRAHPNDGLADVIDVAPAMSPRARWAARGRLPTGTHLPHPDIAVERVRERHWRLPHPLRVWVDGVDVGLATDVAISVEADAFTVHA